MLGLYPKAVFAALARNSGNRAYSSTPVESAGGVSHAWYNSGMSSEPKRKVWWTFIPALIAIYVGGYFLMGSVVEWNHPHEIARWFDHRAVRKAYYPLGWLESKIRREGVDLCSPRPDSEPPGTPQCDECDP
jgi:hypothetical protein